MLLSNRRHRLIYFCLTGMEIAWITPFLLLLYRPFRVYPPLLVFSVIMGTLLVWILSIELVNRFVLDSPQYELSILFLIAATSAVLVRMVAFPNRGLFDFSWILHALQGIINFEAGFPIELFVLLLNFFVWLRATNATSRDIDFWNVGFSFRLGMLLLIVGGAILQQISSQNVTVFLWLYFTFGLSAVTLARIDEKSTDARSTGQLLPSHKLIQLLGMVTLTITLAVGAATIYTPDNIKRVILWLTPLWQVLGNVILWIFSAIFWVIGPILIWLGDLIIRLFSNFDLSSLQEAIESFNSFIESASTPRDTPATSFIEQIPDWVWLSLRYIGILALVLLCLFMVFVFLDKVRPRFLASQTEEEADEAVTFGGNAMQETWQWLKDTAGLVRRYGLSRQLLSAISVENIYVNLCRLAKQRGHPRLPAQPPDDYLPVLAGLFNGREEHLARITVAYMRVHYGNRAVSQEELLQLRADYQEIRSVKTTNR